MPFQPGNKLAASRKPFRDALRLEIKDAGEDHKALREVAAKLIGMARAGDMQAIKELADRIDGKPSQAIIGGEEDDPPIKVTKIELVALTAKDDNNPGSASS